MKYLKSYVKDVQEDEKGTMLVGAIASTESKDRDGDIVKSEGWELDDFRKAPRLLWSHDASQLPIGKVTNIGIRNGELKFNAVFAEKENKFASDVAKMFKSGFLNTFSVGFIPKTRDEDGNIVQQELLEISAVNVPANPEAMTQNSYKSFMEKSIKQTQTSVQTLIMSKKEFKKASDARKWAKDHSFKTSKTDETETSFRFRQFDPAECTKGSQRTILLTSGVSAVVCRKADSNKENKVDNNTNLLILNEIASLKETTLALEEHLKEIKDAPKGVEDKPCGKKQVKHSKQSKEMRLLKLTARTVEHLIRRQKMKGGAK